ncbi:hypothetical protein PLESTB_000915200 [Pleodorina starrii]|uniref:Tetratricopeptide repeat protein 33 n=1 Tax=Pleodorina starrii TaxID=330485 RepID=A0A9W6BNA0_9CHLO|nr:hypothetical protein PLESTM_001526200 [Pleodorina starrii]GLC54875.1 hypothetical protein PLESTB_000915200 [Pleodorina starrii]GLC73676.1 hypothetical protein PLESTF_001407300 [Pleodorina starrii]
MAPAVKKQKFGTLSKAQLQAFADESSDEEPDPIALAADLKERGQEHAAGGRFTEARSLLGQAVRLVPGRADLHELHAQVLLELGCTWEAVRAATRAVELQPQWAEAHVTLGRAQLNLGEPALAEASFERALEHQPEDLEAVSGELREARALAAKQRELGPGLRAVVKLVEGGGGRDDTHPADDPET